MPAGERGRKQKKYISRKKVSNLCFTVMSGMFYPFKLFQQKKKLVLSASLAIAIMQCILAVSEGVGLSLIFLITFASTAYAKKKKGVEL